MTKNLLVHYFYGFTWSMEKSLNKPAQIMGDLVNWQPNCLRLPMQCYAQGFTASYMVSRYQLPA